MKKFSIFIFAVWLKFREWCDPAIEGNPYQKDCYKFSKNNKTSNPNWFYFRRRYVLQRF